jgi:hypothetical protein
MVKFDRPLKQQGSVENGRTASSILTLSQTNKLFLTKGSAVVSEYNLQMFVDIIHFTVEKGWFSMAKNIIQNLIRYSINSQLLRIVEIQVAI